MVDRSFSIISWVEILGNSPITSQSHGIPSRSIEMSA
eukprot:CAMPEP_0174971890 /NCGR_PEP_ID=MMETSP0004_2-20121128/10290_1 /TAXON_ID=420556 /ORGANISM="Ochromonas sp., Strain CCMP1393" /LENGTH=36 /DNA_ID= /DNA_START= /DNA_END= /DNA_ORIENTATION=